MATKILARIIYTPTDVCVSEIYKDEDAGSNDVYNLFLDLCRNQGYSPNDLHVELEPIEVDSNVEKV